MSDPKRLLSDPNAAHEVSSLLRAMPVPRAPTAEKHAELTRRLLSAASPIPTLSLTGPLLGVVLTALVATAAWWALSPSRSEPERRAAAPIAQAAPLAPSAAPPPQEVAPEAVAPPPAASAPRRGSVIVDSLAEEAQLLEDARRALGSAPQRALALLEQHRQRFPNGQLAVERMFLTVQALERTGDKSGALRQVELLVKKFPRSVYANQLRRRLGDDRDKK